MKLSEIIAENNIIPDLKAKDKRAVLEELTDAIVSHEPSLDKSSLIKVLLERERLGSTGIGDGVAIPHGKFQGIMRPIISFGRSRKGLDFDAIHIQKVETRHIPIPVNNYVSTMHIRVMHPFFKHSVNKIPCPGNEVCPLNRFVAHQFPSRGELRNFIDLQRGEESVLAFPPPSQRLGS